MQQLRRLRFWALGAMVAMAAGCAAVPPAAKTSAASPPPSPSPQTASVTEPPAAPETPLQAETLASAPVTPTEQTALQDDTKDITPQYADIWQRIRAGFAIPDMDSPLVDQAAQWYVSRPDYVARMTERARKYLYYTVQEVQKRGMPTELALLPFIESAYNPDARSVAHAVGMWQFIPSTGKHYNLKQNLFQDDRRSVLASTNAALDYLQNLYNMFGNWQIALAAYNWGEGSVQRAIAYNKAHNLPVDYQDLRMPNETRNYYPKLQAVKDIISDPAKYGITLPDIPDHPYFKAVTITRDIDVSLAAKLAGMTVEEFRSLNPAYTKPVILGATNPRILMPYDNATHFAQALQAYNGPLSTWTAYTVKSTQSPVQLARTLDISEAMLRDTNDIPARQLIKAGSTVLIPKADDQANKNVSAAIAENAVLAFAPEAPPGRRMVLRVGKYGDSVERVAHRYHLSPLQVAQWNRTTERGIFRKGQFVTIYVTHTPRIFVAERKADQRRVVAERKTEKRRVVAERKPQIKRRNIVRKPVKVAERQRTERKDLRYSVQTRDKRLIDVAQQ
ncbi:transglycosylase SLT domain-containing protein [Thiomonas bhubaneswarensis]|uniref:Soluble lytic murein transglycosylase and related regulatory proteins (Some contain LysM/invasin domains) n=1 Tax=Thiomonas bhubaneswarensis TaxID=339866 RepID=A0A0K6I5Y8_9BURK|nr:transglycosylase SLT domain-containing protein [Thiomonas bhubaneswarensis]CUA98550.1 Soluble lytic murein transglycosylase and related regulatory proteins (some contain LysM/invasin domains) [Thiomonas bhubaneswarensis]